MKQPLAPWVFDFADAVAAKTLEILQPGWPNFVGPEYPSLQMIDEAVHEAVLSTLPQTYDDPDDNDMETHQ